jgi:hypothetical protein
VAVGVERQADLGVPERLHDRAGIDTLGEQSDAEAVLVARAVTLNAIWNCASCDRASRSSVHSKGRIAAALLSTSR